MTKKIKFKCGKCGKKAILGEHFCDSRDISKYQAKLNYDPDADLGYNAAASSRPAFNLSRAIYATGGIAGIIVLAVFAYQLAGVAALIVVPALGILLIVLWFGGRIAALFFDNSRELLALCRGDRDLVERLILAEKLRHGPISRNQAIAHATRKLLADRMR